MKNRIFTTSIREIKASFKRFLSLLIMSMLGVGVFVGITMASPDMMASLDKYYDDTNLYDIKIVSTLGVTNNDITKIKNIKSIDNVVGSHAKDMIISTNNKEVVVRFIGITEEINKIEVKEGTLPKKENEILVEKDFLTKNKIKLGDFITLLEEDTFNTKKLKIVGVVKSPLYIENVTATSNRGNTTIGTGKIDFYAYIPDDSFRMDYYTELYLTVKDAKEETTNDKEYLNLIDNAQEDINRIKKDRTEARLREVKNKANEEINKQKEENLNKLNAAKRELDTAKIKLDNGKTTLDHTINLLNNSKIQLENTKKMLDDKKIMLDNSKEELDEAKELFNKELSDTNLTYDDLIELSKNFEKIQTSAPKDITADDIIALLPEDSENYEEMVTFINLIYDLNLSDEFIEAIKDKEKMKEFITLIPEDFPYYDQIVDGLNYYIDNMDEVEELIENFNKLKKAENLYNDGLDQYNKGYTTYLSYYNQYQEGLREYNEGVKTYNSNYNLYTSSMEEYYKSKTLFDTKISDAYKELDKINTCQWYVYERLDDTTYSNYIEDGNSVANLAKVFPTIFFVVAVLISLISMSRMVEDDRVEIGTLKSLGFSNKHIRIKYILYSGIATLTGGIIGSILGFYLLPYFIWSIYKILFTVDIFAIKYDFTYIIIGIFIALICICGTTLLTIKKVVKEKPSDLMRPKAPANGKRVILEHIPFIWNHINFSNKVTVRNLFRYKKRVLMTVGGILGCTALMLTGFGIRDAIVDVPDMQYKNIFHFDAMVYLTGENTKEDIRKIFDNSEIENYVETKMVTGTSNKYSTNLFVPENEEDLSKILTLKDLKTSKSLKLVDNEAIISDKLSELTDKEVGEEITFTDSTGKSYAFKVAGIFENYAGNYILINKKTYEQNLEKYNTNVVYMNLKDLNKEESIAKELLTNNNVMSITSSKTTIATVGDMLKSLDSVVLLLIFLSGALSFVVLYNLSFINISERKREIATLKVLGFTDKEVDNYINKETMILTVIGIALGLVFGIVLTNFIIDTVEVDMVRFLHKINLYSFAISALMTLIFTIIVNRITHYTLKKIDMIESLKSVE